MSMGATAAAGTSAIRSAALAFCLAVAALSPAGAPAADPASRAALTRQLASQQADADARHATERGQLANEESRATADYQKQMVGCAADKACKDAATKQYHQRLRELEKKGVDIDTRWRIERARLAAASQIEGLNPAGTTAQCVRPFGTQSRQAALDAADATHIGERERVVEQEMQATADYQKAMIDCNGEAPAGRGRCNSQAVSAYQATLRQLQQQAIEVDERWREARNTIEIISAAKRAAAAGHEDGLYRAGIQAGIAGCAKEGASPLWTDPAAGVRIGTALALGRIAQLANMAGLAAVPGTLQSLQAAMCGPPAASQDPDPFVRGKEDGEAYCKWAAKLAGGAVARTRAPLLAVGAEPDGGAMLREAVGYLKAAAPEQRVGLLQQFADQITAATKGNWLYRRVDLAEGGSMFIGESIGRALVIDGAGRMFRGNVANSGLGPDVQFNYGPGGTLIPNYPRLQPIE